MVFQNSEIVIYLFTIHLLKIIFETLHFENGYQIKYFLFKFPQKAVSTTIHRHVRNRRELSQKMCEERREDSPVWYCRLFRNAEWSVTEWIKQVRSELGCWRAVYWKLWGHCHWQLCSICHTYYPLSQTEWCSYHPDSPQFFIMEQHRTMSFPIGKC